MKVSSVPLQAINSKQLAAAFTHMYCAPVVIWLMYLLTALQAIRAKYIPLIYDAELKEPAKTQYWQTHGTRDSASGDSGGAHFAYLDGLLARNNGGSGYFVGGSLTAADLCLFQIVDLHQRIYKEEMEATVSLSQLACRSWLV
jgi:glutathione S-transferase